MKKGHHSKQDKKQDNKQEKVKEEPKKEVSSTTTAAAQQQAAAPQQPKAPMIPYNDARLVIKSPYNEKHFVYVSLPLYEGMGIKDLFFGTKLAGFVGEVICGKMEMFKVPIQPLSLYGANVLRAIVTGKGFDLGPLAEIPDAVVRIDGFIGMVELLSALEPILQKNTKLAVDDLNKLVFSACEKNGPLSISYASKYLTYEKYRFDPIRAKRFADHMTEQAKIWVEKVEAIKARKAAEQAALEESAQRAAELAKIETKKEPAEKQVEQIIEKPVEKPVEPKVEVAPVSAETPKKEEAPVVEPPKIVVDVPEKLEIVVEPRATDAVPPASEIIAPAAAPIIEEPKPEEKVEVQSEVKAETPVPEATVTTPQ